MATKLLINEPPLQVLPTLATWIGLNEAIFLQQLHYWTSNPKIGKTHEGHKWVRNTVKEWKENFPFWGVNTIRRAIANLEKRELIFSTDTLNKHNYDKSKWYAINYEKLNTLSGPIDQEKEPEKPTTQNGQRIDPLPKMGNGVTQNGQQVLPKMGRPIPETTQRLPENINEQAHLSLSDKPDEKSFSEEKDNTEGKKDHIPTGKKPKEKGNTDEKPKPKTELMEAFIKCTGIKMPKRKTDRGFWWGSIGELYNIANEDVDIGKKLIEYTVQKMRNDNLTIGGPNSLIKTARDIMARRASQHSSNGFKPQPQPNDNYPYLRPGVSIG